MWMKERSDKTVAVGFFTRTDKTVRVDFAWRALRLGASPSVRALWLRRDLGRQKNFVAELPAHGGALLRVQEKSFQFNFNPDQGLAHFNSAAISLPSNAASATGRFAAPRFTMASRKETARKKIA